MTGASSGTETANLSLKDLVPTANRAALPPDLLKELQTLEVLIMQQIEIINAKATTTLGIHVRDCIVQTIQQGLQPLLQRISDIADLEISNAGYEQNLADFMKCVRADDAPAWLNLLEVAKTSPAGAASSGASARRRRSLSDLSDNMPPPLTPQQTPQAGQQGGKRIRPSSVRSIISVVVCDIC